jgi:hypothetical protein
VFDPGFAPDFDHDSDPDSDPDLIVVAWTRGSTAMLHRILILVCLLCLCGLGEARAAFGSCMSPGYLASFDTRLGPASCRVVTTTEVRWRGGSARLRVIVPGGPTPELDRTEAEFRARVEILAERLGDAMDAFGGLELRDTTIVLSNLSFQRFHAGTFGRGDECKVIFYKTSEEVSLERFLFTYAHEIFHCVQGATWPGLHDGAEAGWWIEGSAEYFAHVANPNSAEGDAFVNAFDDASPRDALPDMDYAAVVFFLWLGGREEPRGVRAFLDHMATGSGRNAQLAALRARTPMDEWIEFGQDYLDGRIRQPAGRTPLSVVDRGETFTFSGPARRQLVATPYVLARETFVFRKGRSYALAIENATGELRSRFGLSGRWTDPPEKVLACDEDKHYTVLTTSVEGDDASHVVVARDSEVVNERACCLIGAWRPTANAVQAESRQIVGMGGPSLAAQGVNLSCSPVGSGWSLIFGENGSGSVNWSGFGHRCVARHGEAAMIQTATRVGSIAFDWEVRDRGAGMARYTDNSLMWTHHMQIGPMSMQPRTMPDSGSSIGANGFAYQCTRDTLTVQGIYGLSHLQHTYRRADGPDLPDASDEASPLDVDPPDEEPPPDAEDLPPEP